MLITRFSLNYNESNNEEQTTVKINNLICESNTNTANTLLNGSALMFSGERRFEGRFGGGEPEIITRSRSESWPLAV